MCYKSLYNAFLVQAAVAKHTSNVIVALYLYGIKVGGSRRKLWLA